MKPEKMTEIPNVRGLKGEDGVWTFQVVDVEIDGVNLGDYEVVIDSFSYASSILQIYRPSGQEYKKVILESYCTMIHPHIFGRGVPTPCYPDFFLTNMRTLVDSGKITHAVLAIRNFLFSSRHEQLMRILAKAAEEWKESKSHISTNTA